MKHEDNLMPVPTELSHPPLPISDLEDPYAGNVRREIETAYRRGFMQGAHQANRSYNSTGYKNWLTSELIDWRYKHHYGKAELPPVP